MALWALAPLRCSGYADKAAPDGEPQTTTTTSEGAAVPRPCSPYRTWADAAALRVLADALDAATADLATSPAIPRVLYAGALTLHLDTVDNGQGQQVYAIDLRRPSKRPPSRPVGEPRDRVHAPTDASHSR